MKNHLKSGRIARRKKRLIDLRNPYGLIWYCHSWRLNPGNPCRDDELF